MTRSYSLSNKKQTILRVDKQLMGIQALDTWGKTMFVVSEGPHGTSIPSAPTGCPLAGAPGKSIWTIHSFFTLSSLIKKNIGTAQVDKESSNKPILDHFLVLPPY